MKLNLKAFALTCGIGWAVSVFIYTWWLIALYGATAGTRPGLFYLGYHVSAIGSIIGLIWGFFHGLICGAIFAWLYNLLVDRFPTK
jgi:hypothetical protein